RYRNRLRQQANPVAPIRLSRRSYSDPQPTSPGRLTRRFPRCWFDVRGGLVMRPFEGDVVAQGLELADRPGACSVGVVLGEIAGAGVVVEAAGGGHVPDRG